MSQETIHPHQSLLLQCIQLEDQEQEKRYQLDQQNSLKQLKTAGIALHPIHIVRKSYGYADYPEISFRLPFPLDTSLFKDNSAIECFLEGETSVKGTLIGIDGLKGEFRLYAPDFPEWIEEKGVGIKLTPDLHTSESMKKGITALENNSVSKILFEHIHGESSFENEKDTFAPIEFRNSALNESQQNAVKNIVFSDALSLVHGPPGTGKTSTLIEAIFQLVRKGERVLVSAPSNTAVDHLAKGLVRYQMNILRVGNTLKIDSDIMPFILDGKLADSKEQKELKKLKIRVEELRKMSFQYKRNFGREERDQKRLLLQEVKNLRQEIRKIRNHFNSTVFEKAQVILGTPIGLADFLPATATFDTLVIDEAGQLLEPLAWVIFPYSDKWILCGDPLQLPPTVLSFEATNLGFNTSILEQAMKNCLDVYFLDTQYRMRQVIADFSSKFFYKKQLKSPENKQTTGTHILFYDTAGTGFEEEAGPDGNSLINPGEMKLMAEILTLLQLNISESAFISPYSAQVELGKEELPKNLRISTIDSFQGQEMETILISLVRSNSEGKIGFLSDYRRMNVALTRAKEQLIIVGDSATLGQDIFYEALLNYIEEVGGYRSAWELIS